MFSLLDLTCFFLPLAMLPGLVSAATAPRWAVLALALPLLLWKVDVRAVPHKWLLAAILGYAAASVLWMEVPLDAVPGIWQLALMVAAFAVGSQSSDLRRPLRLMAIATALMLPLVALQAVGYNGLPQTAAPSGLFLNKNVLAELAAAMLVASLLMTDWLVAGLLIAIVLMTKEKAAFFALAVAFAVYLWPRSRVAATVLVLCVIGAGVALLDSASAASRFDIWLDTLQGMTPFGHGIGSFYTAFPEASTRMDLLSARPEQAHNEALHFAFELGIGASLLVLLVVVSLRGRQRETERLVLVAILAESLLAFPLHMPVTAFVAALVAGRLCGRIDGAGDHEHAGGACHA